MPGKKDPPPPRAVNFLGSPDPREYSGSPSAFAGCMVDLEALENGIIDVSFFSSADQQEPKPDISALAEEALRPD